MKKEELVQRVARSICVTRGHDPDGSSGELIGEPNWRAHELEARVFLAAQSASRPGTNIFDSAPRVGGQRRNRV